MNERINTLKRQASLWCDENIPNEFSEEINGYGPAWEDKFAELIILEMCDVLDTAQWDKGEDWICADSMPIIPQIKDHFGIE